MLPKTNLLIGPGLTVNPLLVPVWPLPSLALIVIPVPAVVSVSEPVHTPFVQPVVPVVP